MRTSTRALVVVPVALLSIVAAACGSDHGSTSSGGTAVSHGSTRTIDVTMTDNAFQPTAITVASGETVTFRFINNGAVRHEAVLGDDAAQVTHHQQMPATTMTPAGSTGGAHGNMGKDHHGNPATPATTPGMTPGMGMGGADVVTVEPGQTGEITHTFDHPGTLVIGCHEPGHWESGMKATVTVS